MTNNYAVIGDIHGDSKQLKSLLVNERIRNRSLVFLGDYIDRGPDSRGVIKLLTDYQKASQHQTIFLMGNHEEELIRFLDGGPIAPFLYLGGSQTILSWLPDVQGDIRAEFVSALSPDERNFFKSLKAEWHQPPFYAAHAQTNELISELLPSELLIVGHTIQRDAIPRIVDHCAFIDTGCGTIDNAPLTAILLPELEFVDSSESI
jgi:serine/threonine protein phosphatase 1